MQSSEGDSYVPPEVQAARTSKKSDVENADKEPPTLPSAKFVSSLTHREVFSDYINEKSLLSHHHSGDSPTSGVAAEGSAAIQPPKIDESTSKPYSNVAHIILSNTNKKKILHNCPIIWITQYLLGDHRLPVPFQDTLLMDDKDLWRRRPISEPGDDNFVSLPSLGSGTEPQAMQWFKNLADKLGRSHGLRDDPKSLTSQHSALRGDRTFNCEGANRAPLRGLITRKPDIAVVDRTYRFEVPIDKARLRWPVIQGLIEITSAKKKGYTDLVRTMMDKASNMFDSQLHRQYVLGLAIFNTPANAPKFIFVLIDRVGVACTTPAYIRGVHATVLARIIFAFAYASDAVLGIDPRVSFDRLTGDPLSVLVEEKPFTIITEIYISPYVFGRGTRVYLVRDVRGCFHVLKDSWIRSSHSSSEIDFVKKIAKIVQSENLGDRAQVLSPRFVAGDEHICNTDHFRTLLTSAEPARIHRRIVTGPIGDPITSYRSRVECLHALIDVLDRECSKLIDQRGSFSDFCFLELKFLNDKCGLVHGDVSLFNVTIVRFLRRILAASPLMQSKQASTDAAQGTPSSSSSATQATDQVDTEANELLSLLFKSLNADEGSQKVVWEDDKACPSTGLTYELASGGSLIDFDYTREKNKPDSTTSVRLTLNFYDVI